MSIFKRLFKVGEASVNKIVDKLETPENMVEQAIRDKEKHLKEAKEAVQACIANQRKNAALYQKERSEQERYEKRAIQAQDAGKDELVIKAITLSEEFKGRADSLQPQVEAEKKEMIGLKNTIKSLEEDIQKLKREKDTLIAQYKVNQTKKSIHEARAKIGKSSDTNELLDRMRAKAEDAGYQADAAQELADDAEHSIEDDFKELDQKPSSDDVQAKLAALKNKHS